MRIKRFPIVFLNLRSLKVQPNNSRRSIRPIPNQYSPMNLIGANQAANSKVANLPDVDFFIPTSTPSDDSNINEQTFSDIQELSCFPEVKLTFFEDK